MNFVLREKGGNIVLHFPGMFRKKRSIHKCSSLGMFRKKRSIHKCSRLGMLIKNRSILSVQV